MMKKLAASPVNGGEGAGSEENDDQGVAELGQELKDQRPFSLPMDQVWAELCQARSRLSTAQSVRACGHLFQERRDGELPEWGIRFDGGCRHDGSSGEPDENWQNERRSSLTEQPNIQNRQLAMKGHVEEGDPSHRSTIAAITGGRRRYAAGLQRLPAKWEPVRRRKRIKRNDSRAVSDSSAAEAHAPLLVGKGASQVRFMQT